VIIQFLDLVATLAHRFRKTCSAPKITTLLIRLVNSQRFKHDSESDLADEFKRQPVDQDDSLYVSESDTHQENIEALALEFNDPNTVIEPNMEKRPISFGLSPLTGYSRDLPKDDPQQVQPLGTFILIGYMVGLDGNILRNLRFYRKAKGGRCGRDG